jgi:hypothetical protein
MANYQNRKWEIDKFQPFQDAARTKAALIGGGLQNLSGGVNQGLSGMLGVQMMQGSQQAQQPYTPFMQQQNNLFGQLAKLF